MPNYPEFNCSEYLEHFSAGYYDDPSFLQLVYPIENARELETVRFLAIGSAGADGIEFGYRQGRPGIWAYYPSEERFEEVAPTITALVDGWRNGSISV